MDEIERLVRRAVWRITLRTFLHRFLWAAFAAVTAFAVYVLLERVCHLGWDAAIIGAGAAVAAVAIGILLTILSPTLPFDAALELDQQALLRSRLASAVELGGEKGPMAAAVVEDAIAHSRRVDLAKAIPVTMPRHALFSLVPAVVILLGLWSFLPQYDLFGRRQRENQAAAEKAELAKRAEELKANIKTLEKANEIKNLEIGQKLVGEIKDMADKISEAKSKPEAMAKLAELTEQLQAQRAPAEELKKSLEALQDFAEGDVLKDIADKLRQKDMDGAAQALRKLESQLQKGELSEKDLQKLQQELGKLAEALKQNEKMSEALQQMAKNLMADKERALENLKQAMGEMKNMEKMLAEMELMDLALVELTETKMKLNDPTTSLCPVCKAKLGKLCPAEGPCDCDGEGVCASCAARNQGKEAGAGEGMRGPGTGKGGVSEDGTDAGTSLNRTRVRGKLGEGEILGSIFVKGTPKKGEALVEYSEIVKSARDEAADALSKEEVPLGYKNLVKGYFDSIDPAQSPKHDHGSAEKRDAGEPKQTKGSDKP